MTSHHHEPERIPPLLLFGGGALMVMAILVTAFASLTNIGVQNSAALEVTESLAIQFKDDADGGISVYEYETGKRIWIYPPETGGFVRTAMRAVVHKRKVSGIGAEDPFLLMRTANGRLLIRDPQTNRSIGLEAFGDANANDFAQIIDNWRTTG